MASATLFHGVGSFRFTVMRPVDVAARLLSRARRFAALQLPATLHGQLDQGAAGHALAGPRPFQVRATSSSYFSDWRDHWPHI